MKHAIIIAHPRTRSFTGAMAAAYEEAARALGHEVVVRDLYREGFDPRLAASELPGLAGARPRADAAAERALVQGADVFVFVYPFWFNAPPAMLKGWVDRVLGLGFGYGPGPGGLGPLLDRCRLVSITSSGAPADWVRETGAMGALKTLFDNHLGKICGFEVVDHLHFGGIVEGIRKDAVEDCAAQVREMVRERFGPAKAI